MGAGPADIAQRGGGSEASPRRSVAPQRAHRGAGRSWSLARWPALWAALCVAVPTVACKTGPDLSADYAATARENYELAQGEFKDKDWDEAIAFADFVRIRFPFSRYAVESELLIARAEFEEGNYLTAQDAFKQFSKLHPTHKQVRNGWVSYMAAVAAYMNSPQRFFLLPPHYQRDQSQLKDALVELEYYFDHYSGTITEKFARKLRDDVKRRLLQHELYVANFYLDREKPEAAIGRLESAHDRYPGIGLDAEVLFLLGITYLRMGEVELARSTFAELQSQHPEHHHGRQARIYLKYIFDRYGPADPGRQRPDRTRPAPKPPPAPKNEKRPEHPERAKPEAPTQRTGPAVGSPIPAPPKAEPKGESPDATEPEGTESEADPDTEADPPGGETPDPDEAGDDATEPDPTEPESDDSSAPTQRPTP